MLMAIALASAVTFVHHDGGRLADAAIRMMNRTTITLSCPVPDSGLTPAEKHFFRKTPPVPTTGAKGW